MRLGRGWFLFWAGWFAASLFRLVSNNTPEEVASNARAWLAFFGLA